MKNDKEFNYIIKDILENKKVNEMKNYIQHSDVSCFDHCYNCSYYCYKICKKMKLDYVSAARAAMLHDFFLYDWHIKNNRKGLHAFTHPMCAYENAKKEFNLNNIEKDIIIKHMWPVTLSLPRYKESFILTLVDKYSACMETLSYLIKCLSKKNIWQYGYLIIGFIILKYTELKIKYFLI